MHFEILVEDQSGKRALDILVPKMIGDEHTFVVHPYKGIGRIPKNMRDAKEASRRILMDNLPKLLKGYGRVQAGRNNFSEAVVLVCDLDDKCLKKFRADLNGILSHCNPKPKASFCIAIEEVEAWFLGDLQAVKGAYPRADDAILSSYINDSICGTWETLGQAILSGGYGPLSKTHWAEAIAPRMDVQNNRSPSFCYFREKICALAQAKVQTRSESSAN